MTKTPNISNFAENIPILLQLSNCNLRAVRWDGEKKTMTVEKSLLWSNSEAGKSTQGSYCIYGMNSQRGGWRWRLIDGTPEQDCKVKWLDD